jgi:hypothetical protein
MMDKVNQIPNGNEGSIEPNVDSTKALEAGAVPIPANMTLNATEIIPEAHGITGTATFNNYLNSISNLIPNGTITLVDLYWAIREPELFKVITDTANKIYKIDGMQKSARYSDYKRKNFSYVTFGGTFTMRCNSCVIAPSGYYCLDIDNLDDVVAYKKRIIAIEDPAFETEFLFTSPSGYGLKWVISIDSDASYDNTFKGIQQYIKTTYDIEMDSTPDISRACFICYDDNCFINPKYF